LSVLRPFFILLITVLIADAEELRPRDLAFVLDTNPTLIEMQRTIAAGARLATTELAAADTVAVISVASGTKVHLPPSTSPEAISRAFHRASSWRLTVVGHRRLYDGLASALTQFPNTLDERRRRAIVLVTNETDRGSTTTATDLIREARRKEVAVWVIVVAQPSIPRALEPTLADPHTAEVFFRNLALATGGGVLRRDGSGYLLRQCIADLKEKSN